MKSCVFLVNKDLLYLFKEAKQECPNDVSAISKNGIDGSEILLIIIKITTTSLPIILKIVKDLKNKSQDPQMLSIKNMVIELQINNRQIFKLDIKQETFNNIQNKIIEINNKDE